MKQDKAAPAQAAVITTSFQQAISVGGVTPEATAAAPHQGGCNDLVNEVVSPTAWAKGSSRSNCSYREGRLRCKDTSLKMDKGDKEVELKPAPPP